MGSYAPRMGANTCVPRKPLSGLSVRGLHVKLAALFVDPKGPYFGREDIEPWDSERDARKYAGPLPVIAHPPCERWGRYWHGGPSVRVRRIKGDDQGCFAVALWAVRTFGGVLEHPEASHAWRWYGMERPSKAGGWTGQDQFGGRSCCVEQGHYGHPARKATWLYYVGDATPRDLIWGPSGGVRMEDGFHSTEERKAARLAGVPPVKRISALERVVTPRAFSELLIQIASQAR